MEYKSHYEWLNQNLNVFLKNLGIDINAESLISSHGDKCYGFKFKWKKAGVPFFHGVAIYLLTHLEPYSKEVRESSVGWIMVDNWVIENYERFLPYLPAIN